METLVNGTYRCTSLQDRLSGPGMKRTRFGAHELTNEIDLGLKTESRITLGLVQSWSELKVSFHSKITLQETGLVALLVTLVTCSLVPLSVLFSGSGISTTGPGIRIMPSDISRDLSIQDRREEPRNRSID